MMNCIFLFTKIFQQSSFISQRAEALHKMPLNYMKYDDAIFSLQEKWDCGEAQVMGTDGLKTFAEQSDILVRPRSFADIPDVSHGRNVEGHFDEFLYERCVALKDQLSLKLQEQVIQGRIPIWNKPLQKAFNSKIVKKLHDYLLQLYIDIHIDAGYPWTEPMILSIYGSRGGLS